MVLRDLPSYLFPKMSIKKGFFRSLLPFWGASDIQVLDFLVLLLSPVMLYTLFSFFSGCDLESPKDFRS